MAEVEQSQPQSSARSIVSETFKDFAPEPEAPQAEALAPVVEDTFDPATITIPNRQFAGNVPKSLEKFKDKTLVDFANSYEEAERGFHTKAQEAAAAKRENEELKTRLAAAEQFGRMNQPHVQQPVHDPYAGINPDEAIITNPRGVLNATLSESQRIAQFEAQKAAQAESAKWQEQMRQQNEAASLISAFELARGEVSKLTGRDVTVDEWQSDLQDIARIVHAREPERKFDHKAYVDTYVRLRGVPKVSVPTEGNAPLSSRPASVKSDNTPTMSREEQQMKKQIWGALGLKS